MKIARVVASLLACCGALPASAADVAAGKEKAALCAGCHGMNGIGIQSLYPNLAGQNDLYLANALKAYRSGQRADATMQAMAAGLSDADIDNLAAYFSAQACR